MTTLRQEMHEIWVYVFNKKYNLFKHFGWSCSQCMDIFHCIFMLTSGICLSDVRQWIEQCLCCRCWWSEDKCVLRWRRSVAPKHKVHSKARDFVIASWKYPFCGGSRKTYWCKNQLSICARIRGCGFNATQVVMVCCKETQGTFYKLVCCGVMASSLLRWFWN